MMPIENTWPCIVSLSLANKKSWSKIWLKFKLDFTPLKSFYTEHQLLLGSKLFLFKVKTVDVVTKVEGWWWLWKCARGHPFGAKIFMGICPRTLSEHSKKQTVFLERSSRKTVSVFLERSSRKTVSFEKQIMSNDKYPSIYIYFHAKWRLHCVYYPSNIFHNMCSFENWGISPDILQF